MKEVSVNSSFKFSLDYRNGEFYSNEQKVALDVANVGGKSFSILLDNKSYVAELVEVKAAEKSIVIKINSTEYVVRVKDEYDALLHRLGFDKMLAAELQDVKAPMPGLVLKLLVNAGDRVSKGDSLIILEAMKMENILKASSDGVVKSLAVKEGQKVEKNQLLISF